MFDLNTLSLVIYLSDVIRSITKVLIIFGFITLILTSVAFIGKWVTAHDYIKLKDYNGDAYHKLSSKAVAIFWHDVARYRFLTLFLGAFLFVLGNLLPSKEAIRMIAASEIGETIVLTDENIDLARDLRNYLHQQIKDKVK